MKLKTKTKMRQLLMSSPKRLLAIYDKWYSFFLNRERKFQEKMRQEVIRILSDDFGGQVEMSERIDEMNNGFCIQLVDKHGWSETPWVNNIFLNKVAPDADVKVCFNVSSEGDWGDINEDYPYNLDWSDILRTLLEIKEELASGEATIEEHYLKYNYEN